MGAALAASLLSGCKKKPPAPVADWAKLEARIGQVEDDVRALVEANRDLALRVDSLATLQSQAVSAASRGRSGSRGRSDSGGETAAAGRAGGDLLAIDLARQKVIFSNYEMLQRQGFKGDTIPTFLSRKYGVDAGTVDAIARRGLEEGW